ncbi:hypothetical protein FU659_13125 [Paenibacillus sp. N3.4]|nr:hypothetical protein FU659_13125 [Paenibacillus sp. N3.4]
MTEWIKGRSLQNDDQDYKALGRALAHLHTCCKDLPPAHSSTTLRKAKIFKAQERLFRLHLTHKKTLPIDGFEEIRINAKT